MLGSPTPTEAQSRTQAAAGRDVLGDDLQDGRSRGARSPRRARDQAPPRMTPEQTVSLAQSIATSAGTACQVTDAKFLGQDAERVQYLEATCASGPGYILASAEPPRALDCVLLLSQAEVERARDPEADVGMQCTYPQNVDSLRVIAAYAAEAGVPCTPDQGVAIGTIPNGVAYEVGCSGAQGYRLEGRPGSWTTLECLQVAAQGGQCRFTTPEEGAASLKTMLAGSEAAACDVSQARFMGENANGRFYEAKCSAGDGVIARIKDGSVEQVYPCETAQRIGGGCTLTQVAAAPAAAPAATQQN